jgi:uncharacterized 2Fe-2S/4Fe-4S cluster protein (DUF4445 family)
VSGVDTMPQPMIVFTPSGRRGRFDAGTTILDAGRALGVDIDSVCGGRGLCGRCQVQPSLGEFPKLGLVSQADHLSAPGEVESEYDQLHGLPADRRLACTATMRSDVVIDVPPESQVHRQFVRKELARRAFEIDPVVRLHYVQVAPPCWPRRAATWRASRTPWPPSGAWPTWRPTCR